MLNSEKVITIIITKVEISNSFYIRIENLNLEKNNLGNQAVILLLEGAKKNYKLKKLNLANN